jgi:7-carboxy-7-deazaguanine synthase
VTDLVVSEVFGPTVQGEGPSTGRRCGFVRLGRCNLACTWCDTPYTWRWSDHDPAVELHTMAVDTVLRQLDAMAIEMVVITGGEPLLQQRALADLVASLRGERGWRVEVETAGTIAPQLDVDRWNVSPKLANSGNAVEHRYKPDVLLAFEATGRASFKFVVSAPSDVDEVAAIVDAAQLTDVWLMPEGTDRDTVRRGLEWLAPLAIDRGWNVTPRLHIELWGDERGR